MLGLIMLSLSAQPIVSLAQTTTATVDDPWDIVKTVPFGAELEVRLNNKAKLKGRLHTVSDTTLRLSRKNEIAELDRASVLKVYRLYPKSEEFKRLTSGVGATIGGGAGLGITLSTRGSGYNRPSTSVILIPLAGLALGAIGGYLIGDRMRTRLLIYDAGQPQQAAPSKPKPTKP
jgi:hypothetical protein